MTKQAKSGDLHYLINPGFNKVNRLFFWSFKYFDVPVKNKEEAYKKLLKWVKILIT